MTYWLICFALLAAYVAKPAVFTYAMVAVVDEWTRRNAPRESV